MYDKNESEEISSHQNSTEVIDHAFDYNEINLINTEEEADVTPNHSIKSTNDVSMDYDPNFIHKYYAPFLSLKIHEGIFSGS